MNRQVENAKTSLRSLSRRFRPYRAHSFRVWARHGERQVPDEIWVISDAAREPAGTPLDPEGLLRLKLAGEAR